MENIAGLDAMIVLTLCIFGAWVSHRMILMYQRNTDWLSLALTSIGDAVLSTDKRGKIIKLNSSAEKLLGLSLAETIGKPASEIVRFINHDTRAEVQNPVTVTLASGTVTKLADNSLLRSRDNREIPVECVSAPIVSRDNRIRGTVLVFRDISERYSALQKLAESEDRLRAVTNEARIGLVMINRDRKYIYANNFYMQMIGYSDVFVLGKRVQDVVPVLYEQIKPNLDRAFSGERVSYEVRGINKKEVGLNRIYSVTYEPQVRQKLVVNVVIVVLDITDIKAAATER